MCLGHDGYKPPTHRITFKRPEVRSEPHIQTVSGTANPFAETLALVAVPDKSSPFPGGESQHHRVVTSDNVPICARYGQVGLPPVSEIAPIQQ